MCIRDSYQHQRDKLLPPKQNPIHTVDYDKGLNYLGYNFDVTDFEDNIVLKIDASFVDKEACVKYEVVAWTTGIVTMIPSLAYMNSFSSPGELHTYELSVSTPTTIYIEVMQCLGEVEFFICDSLQLIGDRKYDIKKSETINGITFSSFNAKKGIYYISIRNLTASPHNSLDGKRTWYNMYQSSRGREHPYITGDYAVEDLGEIKYFATGDEVILYWGRIINPKNSKEIRQVIYSVYVSEEGKANMLTACGMKFTHAKQIAVDISATSFKWTIEQKYRQKKLIFNVVAHLYDLGHLVAYVPATYTPKNKVLWIRTFSINSSYRFTPVSYTHLTLPTICSV
eukprot:TRINITY_DN2182_c0_g3_i4.p1 TRINITY_DN2182_c0_g3~~TRINITY_DN2182_c0_g3_i4.p1  ORF type:complete len:340 (-),score=59.99 TRINITY_DN2182_c0_g3_i4:35-1054(-)